MDDSDPMDGSCAPYCLRQTGGWDQRDDWAVMHDLGQMGGWDRTDDWDVMHDWEQPDGSGQKGGSVCSHVEPAA